jgi:hypothetical protein
MPPVRISPADVHGASPRASDENATSPGFRNAPNVARLEGKKVSGEFKRALAPKGHTANPMKAPRDMKRGLSMRNQIMKYDAGVGEKGERKRGNLAER